MEKRGRHPGNMRSFSRESFEILHFGVPSGMRVKNIAVLDETLYNKVINDAYEIMIGRRYKMKRHTCFTVLGKPFFSIGGQLHNSSGYSLGAQSGS